MKSLTLTNVFFLTLSFFAKGNMDCIWSSSKAGITIRYVAPCQFKNQAFVDSILTNIITTLNRKDTSLHILALINDQNISFPDSKSTYFISIGFDTLRLMDEDFIYDYYQNKTILSEEKNNGTNMFDSRISPIDIASTKKATDNQIGIKLIYNVDYSDKKTIWTDIKKLIIYASENSQIIKSTQKRDTVRYWTNGWYISLLTIDTTQINKILGNVSDTMPKPLTIFPPRVKYILLSLVALSLFILVFYARRKHSS